MPWTGLVNSLVSSRVDRSGRLTGWTGLSRLVWGGPVRRSSRVDRSSSPGRRRTGLPPRLVRWSGLVGQTSLVRWTGLVEQTSLTGRLGVSSPPVRTRMLLSVSRQPRLDWSG